MFDPETSSDRKLEVTQYSYSDYFLGTCTYEYLFILLSLLKQVKIQN